MDSHLPAIPPTTFVETFIDEMIKALSTRSGKPWRGGASAPAPSEESRDDDFSATITVTGSLNGDMHLSIASKDALALGSALLVKTSSELGEPEMAALTQLLDSALASFCESRVELYGLFTATAAISSGLSTEFLEPYRFSLIDESGVELLLEVFVSPELSESLAVAMSIQKPMLKPDLPSESADTSPQTADPVNLELVLDVELSVTLRFGQRKLTLREVLELTSGSVIELDRQVEEPVELLLEGKVIARGEAVVIDGNYGLRVTEVPQQLTPTMLR